MPYGTACKVYEKIAATDVAADGIRPGGLELTERALAWCEFPPHSVILDVGCGTGVTLDRLTRIHDFSAIGIDASSALLNQSLMRNTALVLVRAAGEMLPFPDESADGIFAECSLSVMGDPGRALDEFRRVLKIGGRLILSDVYTRKPESVHKLKQIPLECCLRGAVSKENLLSRLARRRFKLDFWEDRSDLLARFAVQLIFYYGSMNQFWLRSSAEPIDTDEIRRAVSEAKPGYFLLIARKITGAEIMPKENSQ
jgi:ubiquinone/menaquinone biosynthesis C-methylase UbiE